MELRVLNSKRNRRLRGAGIPMLVPALLLLLLVLLPKQISAKTVYRGRSPGSSRASFIAPVSSDSTRGRRTTPDRRRICRPKRTRTPSRTLSSTTCFSSVSNPFLHSMIQISPMTSTLSMTIRALAALCGSACCGISYGGGGGTLVTLLVAAHMSNLNISPPSHWMYDFCWTHILPASLVLLLLSPPTEQQQRQDDSTIRDVAAVAVPFLVGSIGSVLGCIFSFCICLWGAHHVSALSGKCLLVPKEALVTAGCVCASFIGGPYNFFAAARIVSTSDVFGEDGGMLSSLLGASAADLLVMALYYTTITACLSSKRLKRWFPGRSGMRGDDDSKARNAVSELPKLSISKERMLPVALLSTCVAVIGVSVSHACDRVVQGTECASLVALGALLSRLLPKLFGKSRRKLLADVDAFSTTMSEFCFHLLFAAIGSSANLGEAVRLGGWHSVSSFSFSALAQLVHLIVIMAGSFGISKLVFPLSIDEVLVASNAAIGGPVTAATFAGQEIPDRRGLVVAATVWGVVGYAVGTRIGVLLTQALMPLLAL